LNPFYGYKEEDRNILNPFMDETMKEFSSIDGAFIIRGDGVVLSAGSLLQATDSEHTCCPAGLAAGTPPRQPSAWRRRLHLHRGFLKHRAGHVVSGGGSCCP
jgi:hypothetical protein